MRNITPIDGWLLDEAVVFDLAYPGFAGFLFRASTERRHVCAAFLAVSKIKEADQAEAAAFLIQADHRAILTAAFQQVPRGLRRALGKSGPKSHDAEYYKRLYRAFVRGPAHVVAAVQRMESLSPGHLTMIEMMPADLCDHRVIVRLHGQDQASDLVKAVRLMEQNGIDRVGLASALIRSTAPIESVIQRWMLRLPFPPCPVPQQNGFRPLKDGIELREAALRYRNCSRHYLVGTLVGESAFGEYRHGDGRLAMVRFERRDGLWHLDGAYVPRNRSIPADIKEAVETLAGRHGIVEHRAHKSREDDMAALRRFGRSIFSW
jgi:hypothetical protein